MAALTTNTIPKATDGTHIGDSRITDDGTSIIATSHVIQLTNGGNGNIYMDDTFGGYIQLVIGSGVDDPQIELDDSGTTSLVTISAPSGLIKFFSTATKLTPTAFASLPSSPAEGMMAWVNNSTTNTWGATVAGGGGNKVLAVYNGTNWTVAGK